MSVLIQFPRFLGPAHAWQVVPHAPPGSSLGRAATVPIVSNRGALPQGPAWKPGDWAWRSKGLGNSSAARTPGQTFASAAFQIDDFLTRCRIPDLHGLLPEREGEIDGGGSGDTVGAGQSRSAHASQGTAAAVARCTGDAHAPAPPDPPTRPPESSQYSVLEYSAPCGSFETRSVNVASALSQR